MKKTDKKKVRKPGDLIKAYRAKAGVQSMNANRLQANKNMANGKPKKSKK